MQGKIPSTMSTQHPDNVQAPFFSEFDVVAGESEIKEAFYAFSHLGCEEQMWDFEGKESDAHVVEKLLSLYPQFFKTSPIGKDFRLTFRLPNPSVEKNQGKILLEALESIPRHYDIARSAGTDIAPVFEIILPMTTSAIEVRRIASYYKKFVVGKSSSAIFPEDSLKISDWIGEFLPESINIIPLVENKESLICADKIVGELIENEKLDHLRIFLARSDPALNYGSVPAVLYNKIALSRLWDLSEKTSVPIYPIIGVGSAPFRGNLKPTNVQNCLNEYPSVQTFTIQSSFKYDYPQGEVRDAISRLNSHKISRAPQIDEGLALSLARIVEEKYQKQLMQLEPFVLALSRYVPSRRARRLHVGLFGYSRSMQGISLPRAIPFCAALYSLGIPPEMLGICALSQQQFDDIQQIYAGLREDLSDAMKYCNPENFKIAGPSLESELRLAYGRLSPEIDDAHARLTSQIRSELSQNMPSSLGEKILQAARIRGFLG